MVRPSEDELIARWCAPLASTGIGHRDFGDDCCSVDAPENCRLLVNVDTIVEGIHYFPEDPWDLVARKAIRTNVSDLVSKGAEQFAYMCSLCLPRDWTEESMDLLAAGLSADNLEFGLSLLGGDITMASGNGLVVSITMFGSVPISATVPSRNRAKPNDLIYVSGVIGDSAIGLHLRRHFPLSNKLDSTTTKYFLERYLLPRPRTRLSPIVLKYANASMDISDGFLVDLTRLCRSSNLGAQLEKPVPVSKEAEIALNACPELKRDIVAGGDDYEILLTVSEDKAEDLEREARSVEVSVTRVGRIVEWSGSERLLDLCGEYDLSSRSQSGMGFQHF